MHSSRLAAPTDFPDLLLRQRHRPLTAGERDAFVAGHTVTTLVERAHDAQPKAVAGMDLPDLLVIATLGEAELRQVIVLGLAGYEDGARMACVPAIDADKIVTRDGGVRKV